MRYKTVSLRRLERESARAEKYGQNAWVEPQADDMPKKPVVRGDCASVPRPCPWASCRHNLILEVNPTGSIRSVCPDEGEELPSCALDVAARGPSSLHTIGRIFGLTPERIRQEEERALVNLKAANVLTNEPSSDFYTESKYTQEPLYSEQGDAWVNSGYKNPEWMNQAIKHWNSNES